MSHKTFMVAKGFQFGKHYTTLSTFINKKDRVDKVVSLNENRCLEFMIDDESSVEFIFKENVIYARPGQVDSNNIGIDLIIRNISNQKQLSLISSLITGNKIVELVITLREISEGKIMVYNSVNDDSIKVYGMAIDNGNTIVFDGNRI